MKQEKRHRSDSVSSSSGVQGMMSPLSRGDSCDLVVSVVEDVRLGASFVVMHFLRAMLGEFAARFKIDTVSHSASSAAAAATATATAATAASHDPLLLLHSKDLDKASKLQIFSAFSCSARAYGNLALADRFYTYARQVSRDLYDVLEQTSSQMAIALGMIWLSLATCCKSVRRATHYATIAFNIADQVDLRDDDDTQQKILFFIRLHYYNLTPCEPESALYFPIHGNSPVACGFSLFTALTPAVSAILSEVFILGQEVEKCWTLPPEARARVDAFAKKLPFADPGFLDSLLASEFIHFVRVLLFFHIPKLREVYEADQLRDDFSPFIVETFPRGLALVLIYLLDNLGTGEPTAGRILLSSQFALLRSLLHMVLLDFDSWVTSVRAFFDLVRAPGNKARLLLTPSFATTPGVFTLACVLYQSGMVDLGDLCLELLEIFANRGHLNAITGFTAARISREKALTLRASFLAVVGPGTPDHSPCRARFISLFSSPLGNITANLKKRPAPALQPPPHEPQVPESSSSSPRPGGLPPPSHLAFSSVPVLAPRPLATPQHAPSPTQLAANYPPSVAPGALPSIPTLFGLSNPSFSMPTYAHPYPVPATPPSPFSPSNSGGDHPLVFATLTAAAASEGYQSVDLAALIHLLSANPKFQEALVTNPTLLDFVSSNPSIMKYFIGHPNMVMILSNNPAFLTVLSANPGFLALVAQTPTIIDTLATNPSILQIIVSNPTLLDVVVNNPSILSMVLTNPTWVSMVTSNPSVLSVLARSASRPAEPPAPSPLSLLSAISSFAVPFFSRSSAPAAAPAPAATTATTTATSSRSPLPGIIPGLQSAFSPSSSSPFSPTLSATSASPRSPPVALSHSLSEILDAPEEHQAEILSTFWAQVKEEPLMREIQSLFVYTA